MVALLDTSNQTQIAELLESMTDEEFSELLHYAEDLGARQLAASYVTSHLCHQFGSFASGLRRELAHVARELSPKVDSSPTKNFDGK